jgi:hypothetical protein
MPSEALFRDVSCVVHCGGLAHRLATRADYERANVQATSQLAEAAGRMGVPHFLFISSLNTVPIAAQLADSDASLYSEPNDGYAASKWQSEIALKAVCQRHEQALTIIRPALIYDKELTANLARLGQLMRWWPAALPAVGNRCLVSRPDLVELIVDRAVQSLPDSASSTGVGGHRRTAIRCSADLGSTFCGQMLGNDARVAVSLGGACFGLAWCIGTRRNLAFIDSALLDWCSAIYPRLAVKVDAGVSLPRRVIVVMLLLCLLIASTLGLLLYLRIAPFFRAGRSSDGSRPPCRADRGWSWSRVSQFVGCSVGVGAPS